MNTQSPQGALSIILLPSAEAGAQALGVAHTWAAEGLLKRAVWVRVEDVSLSPYGGASVIGTLLDQGQASVRDLFDILSRSRVRQVSVVVMQVAQPGQPIDGAQLEAANLLVEAIANARPQPLDPAAADSPVDVELLNLITGPTGYTGVNLSRVTSQTYDANLVASPEDRRASDQIDRFVRPDDNLITWALAQAVSVAGIWSGMPDGPLRTLSAQRPGDESALSQANFVKPVRSFARVVTSAPTARRALALAMEEIRFQKNNVFVSDSLLPLTDPARVLDSTLEAFDLVDNGRLAYTTPAATPQPGQATNSIGRELAEFLRFSGREIVRIPRFVIQRFGTRASKRATDALSGEGGDRQVTVLGETADLAKYTEDFERQAIEARTELDNLQTSLPPAAPEVWRTLRKTLLGLLDGSSIPEPMPTPLVADQRVVIASTTLVVPPPIPWMPAVETLEQVASDYGFDDLFVPACSPWQAEWVSDVLRKQEEQEEATADSTQRRLIAADQALSLATEVAESEDIDTAQVAPVEDSRQDLEDAVTAVEPATRSCPDCGEAWTEDVAFCAGCGRAVASPADTDAAAYASSDQSESTHEDLTPPPAVQDESIAAPSTSSGGIDRGLAEEYKRAKEDHAAGARRLQQLQKESETLTAWLQERERSLLWRLAQRVQNRSLQAAGDSRAFYEEAVSVPSIDGEEPRRARNQFANRFLLMCSIALLLVALTASLGGRLARLLHIPTWALWALILLIILVWLVIILLSYYRRRSRFLAVLRQWRHLQRDARRRCIESTFAENNLKGLYEQLVEWGEILGYVVHDPWHPDQAWFSGLPDADLAANLPTCVDLAVPDPDDQQGTRRLTRAALASVASEGWRIRTFNELLDIALSERDIGGVGSDASVVDLDAPATPNGSRRLMLELLRDGRLQQLAATAAMKSKAQSLYAERATLTSHALRPVNSEFAGEHTGLLDTGGELELLRPSWGDFLTGVLDGSTQFSHALWSELGRASADVRHRMDSLLYAPPGLRSGQPPGGAILIDARPADQNRGVEIAVRCDFGPATESSRLRIFSDDETGLPFETDGAAPPSARAAPKNGTSVTQHDLREFT